MRIFEATGTKKSPGPAAHGPGQCLLILAQELRLADDNLRILAPVGEIEAV